MCDPAREFVAHSRECAIGALVTPVGSVLNFRVVWRLDRGYDGHMTEGLTALVAIACPGQPGTFGASGAPPD
jgi:hypothetical protein